MESSKEILEAWLSSPKFWKGKKLCDFFVKAYNQIKGKLLSDDNMLEDTENASVWNLWSGSKSWEEVLGDKHFEIVTKYDDKAPSPSNKKSPTTARMSPVLEVLRLIRNKHEHNEHLTVYNDELNWYIESEGKLIFDENLYGNYWNTKFPNLGLYAWTKLESINIIKTALKSFYPKDPNSRISSLLPDNLSIALERGFNIHKNEGYMCSRYKMESIKLILEFRTIPEHIICEVLQNSQAMSALIHGGYSKCRWYDEFGFVTEIEQGNRIGTSFQMTVIIANSIANVTFVMMNDAVNYLDTKTLPKKSLIFLLANQVGKNEHDNRRLVSLLEMLCSSLNQKIIEQPLSWQELILEAQNKVRVSNIVKIQNKCYSLSTLLSQSPNEDSVLQQLKGDLLSKLLRGKTTQIFKKLAISSLPEIYMERRIQKRITVRLAELGEQGNADFVDAEMFVLGGISKFELFQYSNVILKNEQTKDLNSLAEIGISPVKYNCVDKTKFFLFSKLLVETLSAIPSTKNIHFLKYIRDDIFKWVYTRGSTNVFQARPSNFDDESKVLPETEFIESLTSIRKSEKIFFIADQPGMGKTLILQSLAHKLTSLTSASRIVVNTEFVDFLKVINQHNLENSDVLTATCKLVSSNDFEELLFAHLLEVPSNAFQIEIMLDALDEIPQHLQEKAISILEALISSTKFVRVWVTLRKHMLNDISSKFGSLGYNLLPFSENEQINFLVQHWSLYGKRRNASEANTNLESKEIRDFAKSVISLRLTSDERDIAGIPLQCKMLAEIYENEVYEGNLQIIANVKSLLDIYDQLFERKFEVYIQEKNKIDRNPRHSLRQILRQTFESVHAYFAIKMIISRELANEFQIHLLPPPFILADPESFVVELGMVSSVNPLKFVHRTFAEYSLAKFGFKGIQNVVIGLPENGKLFSNFFWDNLLNIELHELPRFKHETVCFFFNEQLSHFDIPGNLEKPLTQFCDTTKHCFIHDSILNSYTVNLLRIVAAAGSYLRNVTYFLWIRQNDILSLILCAFAFLEPSRINLIVLEIICMVKSLFIETRNPTFREFNEAMSNVCETTDITSLKFEDIILFIERFIGVLVEKNPTLLQNTNSDGKTLFHVLGEIVSPQKSIQMENTFPRLDWLLHVLLKLGTNPLEKNPLGQNAYDLAVENGHLNFIVLNVKSFQDYLEANAELINKLYGNEFLHSIIWVTCLLWRHKVTWQKLEGSQFVDITLTHVIDFMKFIVTKCQPLLDEPDKNSKTPLLFLMSIIEELDQNETDNIVCNMLLSTLLELKANENAMDDSRKTVPNY